MKAKISDLVGMNLRHIKFGIEVEIEYEGQVLYDNEVWSEHADNSLRGQSMELVFRTPLPIVKALKEIKKLYKEFKEKHCKVVPSIRTSVHVHVNVLNMTETELLTLLTTYYLLEPHLEVLVGDRVNSYYCRTLNGSSKAMIDLISKLEFSGNNLKDIIEEWYVENKRYGSIDLSAIKRFGSLEFRLFPLTEDYKPLYFWVKLLYKLVRYSLNNTPKKVFDTSEKELLSVFKLENTGTYSNRGLIGCLAVAKDSWEDFGADL